MKRKLVMTAILLTILLGSMYATKHSKDEYAAWLADQAEERLKDSNPLVKKGFSLFGEQLIKVTTKEKYICTFI